MTINIVAAVVSGIAATAVFTGLMMMAPTMGMPKMDIPGLLGSMFGAPGNKSVGLVMHFMMGTIFALIYGLLFSLIPGANLILLGVIFGAVHWLIVGLMMGAIPMMHAGIQSGDVAAPGMYMTGVGVMGFVGGLIGHMVYGLAIGLVYSLIS